MCQDAQMLLETFYYQLNSKKKNRLLVQVTNTWPSIFKNRAYANSFLFFW